MESDDEEDFTGFEMQHSNGNHSNSTLSSMGQEKVVLIKPENDAFFLNPLEVSSSLKNSPFAQIKPKDVRTNKIKKILSIELEEKDKHMIPSFLKITRLGDWVVECYQPYSDSQISGVIFPISETVNLEELKNIYLIKFSINNYYVKNQTLKNLLLNSTLKYIKVIDYKL